MQSWQFSANSVHYLLGLWQRMVASVPYIRSTEPHHLNTYVPEVGLCVLFACVCVCARKINLLMDTSF